MAQERNRMRKMERYELAGANPRGAEAKTPARYANAAQPLRSRSPDCPVCKDAHSYTDRDNFPAKRAGRLSRRQ